MSAVPVLETQQSHPRATATAQGLHTLAPQTAHSLRASTQMQLRVLRGRAWVTLGTGPGGWLDESGDLVLHAGQSLCVQPGQQVVLEPLDGQALQWQWRRAAEAPSPAAASRACPAPAQACSA